jgi:predicted thioesterase
MLEETVDIEAVYIGIKEREIICEYVVKVGKRLIAKGTTGQKILQKEKLTKIFEQLSK